MTKTSRSLLERAQAIFQLLKRENVPFVVSNESSIPKSAFQEVGISPKDIDQWLNLVQYIQSQPRILVEKQGRITRVNTLEFPLLLDLRKKFYDTELSYEERSSAMLMYLRILINLEKSQGEGINWKELINDPWEISRPTIIRLVEEAEERNNSP